MRAEAKEEANVEDGSLLAHLESSSWDVLPIPPISTPITADQPSTLSEEASTETHDKGGTGNTDGHTRYTKHGEPPAYKGQLSQILLSVERDVVRACSSLT